MKLITSLTLILSSQALGQVNNTIGCFVEGECLGGVSAGITSADTAQDCVEFCYSMDGCEYFTYSPTGGVCVAFADCPELSSDSCQDCVSGDATCPSELCGLTGIVH